MRLTLEREKELREWAAKLLHHGEQDNMNELLAEINALREDVLVLAGKINKRTQERDDLLLLHERTVKFVLPGLMDSPGAYRKILKDAETERNTLRAALKAVKQDAIECHDEVAQWVFSKWAMDKINSALAVDTSRKEPSDES